MNAHTPPPASLDEAEHFLGLLDPPATSFTFQTFDDDPVRSMRGLAAVIEGHLGHKLLTENYGLGAGVFVTVNQTDGRGRTKSNIRRVRAVWVEDDSKDAATRTFPIAPSIVVESSPGKRHFYWLVADLWPNDRQGAADFDGVMRRMIADHGSDRGVKDISRVLRVPGFLHRKTPATPHPVKLLDANGRRYTRAEIMAAFPPIVAGTSYKGKTASVGDESDSALIADITSGTSYYESLLSLSARFVGRRHHGAAVIKALYEYMDRVPAELQDQRWRDRRNIIPDLVLSAEAKWRSGILGSSSLDLDPPQPRIDDAPPTQPIDPPTPCTLAELHATFRKWLGSEYDTDAIDAVLATAASERLGGDPLWLLVVSGPGAAKTETVQALMGCGAHVTSTIASEGALLSGSSKKEKVKGATGGLLRKIGDRGILVIKDVTSIISADRNIRGTVLAALREVYDGRWERNLGVDGGRTLTWLGRICIVGAVTTAWDMAHAVVASMGDRFVLIRIDSNQGRKQSGARAIRNTGGEVQMRSELAAAVGGVIEQASTDAIDLTEAEAAQVLSAADIVTMARTGVERDYSGEIIDSHAPEMPTRFAKQLTQMIRGGVAVGMSREEAMRLAIRCARDSIPTLRLEILLDIIQHPNSRPVDVRRRTSKPWRTTKRELEALTMLGLLRCDEEGNPEDRNTVWRYRLHEAADRDTLLAMAVRRADADDFG